MIPPTPQRKSARLSRSLPQLVLVGVIVAIAFQSRAHIVPPESLHPVVESYRRMNFLLNLNPIAWNEVAPDAEVVMAALAEIDPREAEEYRAEVRAIFARASEGRLSPDERKDAARALMEVCTISVAQTLIGRLDQAGSSLGEYRASAAALDEARQLWAGFEHEVKTTDRPAFMELGRAWLRLSGALGTPGVLGEGTVAPDAQTYEAAASRIQAYVGSSFGEGFKAPTQGRLVPLPARSATFNASAKVPPRLPPGSNINKQLPRPRQILGIGDRGVDEGETILIALGDMVFDSPYVFGEPARSLGISCNTCHNKSITNPTLFIPGLSRVEGGMDVSNSFFAPHANNGVFDPLDIPDLRGIRFTAPYGRNGRFASLREFSRNVIVNEFNGPEPDPMLMDGLIAYMNEFEFLANPALDANGVLTEKASPAAVRGETIFRTNFKGMAGRSCATCHDPSANFVDHRRHDIGTVAGAGPDSQDRALDTPTLLGIKYTAPYFHDGRAATLDEVSGWFNDRFSLGLDRDELDDLTAYVETVGDGVEAYEDTMYTLEAELEEFRFFLSAYEYLKQVGNTQLISTTFQTISAEIEAHKWDVQDERQMPILDRLSELMFQAYEANEAGDIDTVDERVADYRRLYTENAEYLI